MSDYLPSPPRGYPPAPSGGYPSPPSGGQYGDDTQRGDHLGYTPPMDPREQAPADTAEVAHAKVIVTDASEQALSPGETPEELPRPGPPDPTAAKVGAEDSKREARRRERRVALVLGPLILLGVAFGAGYATAYDDGGDLAAAERRIERQNDQIDRLGDSVDNVTARWRQEQDMNDELRAELQRIQTEVEDQQTALDTREAELDAREAEISAAEAAAQANTFSDGIHQVGRDIQPGQYHTDGAPGGCYYALLTAPSGPSVDHIIDNNNIEGPATLIIDSPYFETSGGCSWTKIG